MPPDVQRVCVFRALVLGDLLCATPALRALRAARPAAHIALVGLPAMRELVSRLASVDEFIDFPGWPGLPERTLESPGAPARFIGRMRARNDDLALQLHGSGAVVNPLVHAFGARHSAGFRGAGAWAPAEDAKRYVAWPEHGTEVERLLALTDHLGCARQGVQLDFPLRAADRDEGAQLLQAASLDSPIDLQRCCIVHAGSQLPSRRWAPERFAAVADAVADAHGLTVLLTGSAAEAPLTAAVARAMRHRSVDIAGRTTLWTLGALVEQAALVLSNDTGLSHVAAALRTPSVIVSSGGDARRWQPHDRALHTVLWQDLPCRPCANAQCPTGHECAASISVAQVRDVALAAVSLRSLAPTAAAHRVAASVHCSPMAHA